MKAVIMAGGMGTRLRPITGERPKPMADILGRPIMEHIVSHLKDCGFDELCAAVKYRAGDIIAHFGDGSGFGVQMEYRIETEALGTAGAVKNCAEFYGDEDFLVISADAACDFPLARLMQAHKASGAAVSIALYRHKSPLRYGLALQDSEGFIRAFIEKPDWTRVVTDCVNTGIYVISPRAMELVPQGQAMDFGKELFPELLRRGEKILGLELEGYWRDIGTPADYHRCCADAWEGKWALPLPVADEGRASFTADAPLAQARAKREGQMRQGGETVGTVLPDDPRDVEDASSPKGGAKSLPSPRGEGAEQSEADEGSRSLLIPVSDRAGLMGILSAELMELGADYRNGIFISAPRMEISIRPAAERSALRMAVKSDDAELARDMLALGKDMVEKLEAPI